MLFLWGLPFLENPPVVRESWVNPADVVVSKLQIVHLTQVTNGDPKWKWSPKCHLTSRHLSLSYMVYTLYEQAHNPSVFKVTPFMWKVIIRQLKHISTT